MKILITGNKGYIGSVLVPMLIKKGYEIVGYDSGYFSENLLEDFDDNYTQITKDIRDIDKEDLKNTENNLRDELKNDNENLRYELKNDIKLLSEKMEKRISQSTNKI